jgi:hypothetical protein
MDKKTQKGPIDGKIGWQSRPGLFQRHVHTKYNLAHSQSEAITLRLYLKHIQIRSKVAEMHPKTGLSMLTHEFVARCIAKDRRIDDLNL